jgi:hypothetical protein
MWWQLLAELILDQGQSVTVVDYARLLSEPESVLDEVLAGYDAGARLSAPEIEPREVDTEVLDAADLQAIRGICSQSAADLGLSD